MRHVMWNKWIYSLSVFFDGHSLHEDRDRTKEKYTDADLMEDKHTSLQHGSLCAKFTFWQKQIYDNQPTMVIIDKGISNKRNQRKVVHFAGHCACWQLWWQDLSKLDISRLLPVYTPWDNCVLYLPEYGLHHASSKQTTYDGFKQLCHKRRGLYKEISMRELIVSDRSILQNQSIHDLHLSPGNS